MPPYNPLAASSLLNQQYAAALSLGEEMIRTLFMSERSCAFLYNARRRSCFSTKWVLCDQYYRVCRQTPEEKSMTKTTLIIFLYLSLLQHSNSPKLAIYLKNEVSCIFMLLQLHFLIHLQFLSPVECARNKFVPISFSSYSFLPPFLRLMLLKMQCAVLFRNCKV